MAPAVIDLTADDTPEVVNLISDEEQLQDAPSASEPKKRRRSRKSKRNKEAAEPEPEPEPEHDEPLVNGFPLPAPTPKTSRKSKDRGRRDRDRDHDREDSTRRRHDKSESPRRSRSPSRRRRHRSPSSERERRPRRRSPSPERPRSPSPPPFVIDTSATILPNMDDFDSPSKRNGADQGLILPNHVSLYKEGQEPTAQERAETPLSEVSFIEVVDLDPDSRKTARYYDENEKPSSIICTTCGQPGHVAKRCTMVVCLMCGAKGEHITPMCPVSRVCFNCNQKGHLSKDCTQPRRYGRQTQHDCDRCGSSNHLYNNCPFLWRLYVYVNDAERDALLAARLAKRNLALGGGGGEGYIAMDEFCYNCAGRGHLGDDCPQGGRHSDRARDPSAFSAYNQASGPFASQPMHEHAAKLRHRSRSPTVRALPADKRRPGKDAKEKQKRRGQELQRRAEEREEDEEDWFSRQQNRGVGTGGNSRREKSRDKEREWDRDKKRDKDRGRRNGDHDRHGHSHSHPHSRSQHHSYSSSKRHNGGSGWNDERSSRSYSNGPRFKGGYS